ncbi:hypothetical protein ACF065_31240 [Streptomyces sp. NPDC015232]|uniref:hypothetical protein n=1 Tax=unclassified Streptomyces TaxID=2593676 RepID=UPI0036FF8A4E
MNPQTYARLYGAARPAPGGRGTGVAVVAGVVWGVVVLVLHGFGLLALVMLAGGESLGELLVRAAPAGVPAVALPAVVACTPAARRLTVPGRFLVTGLVALPVFLGLALWALASG